METQVKSKLLPLDKFVEVQSQNADGKIIRFEVLFDGQVVPCNQCGADIGWGLTARRKWIPFGAESHVVHFNECKPEEVDL